MTSPDVTSTNLVVVLLKSHLNVQPRELAQMSVRVAVLRTEHGSHREDTLNIRADRHLLVELRRLCQIGRALEVRHLEEKGLLDI